MSDIPTLQFPGRLVMEEGGKTSLTIYYAGETYTADDTHPIWEQIIEGAFDGDESIFDLFNIGLAVGKRLSLSSRVSYANGYLFLDDDLVADGLAKHVVRMVMAEEDVAPWVALLENIQQNPSVNSRGQLFNYIDRNQITITREGELVLYKYVYRNHDEEFKSVSDPEKVAAYRSGNAGPAIVNGVPHRSGCVPQDIGDVVSMPRSEVTDDPDIACSSGLHVGAWAYIQGYECKLEIHVHPRDVVSVPSDSQERKVRVCKYRIIGEVGQEYTEPVLPEVQFEAEHSTDPEPLETPTDPTVSDSGASDPIGGIESHPALKHPSKKEFEIAKLTARAQKKGLVKFATERNGWTQVGDDPTNRMSWSKS